MNIFSGFCVRRGLALFAVGLLVTSVSFTAEASEINLTDLKSQAEIAGADPQKEFDLISRDIGRAIFINPANSPEPLGILGFNAGIEVLFVNVDSAPFEHAAGQSIPGSILPVPRLRVQKGLPWGIDVGISYLPEANRVNVGMYGGEIRVDLLDSIPVPTPLLHLSGRFSYSKLTGVSNLNVSTYGFDLSGGVNLPLIKPYVGVGQMKIRSSIKNLAALGLNNSNHNKANFFAGVKLALIPLVPLTVEYSNSTRSVISVKAAVEF